MANGSNRPPGSDVLDTIAAFQNSPGAPPRTRQEARAAVPSGHQLPGAMASPDTIAQQASAARDTAMAMGEAAQTPGARGETMDVNRLNQVLSFLRGLTQAGRQAGQAVGQELSSVSFQDLNPIALNRSLIERAIAAFKGEPKPTTRPKNGKPKKNGNGKPKKNGNGKPKKNGNGKPKKNGK